MYFYWKKLCILIVSLCILIAVFVLSVSSQTRLPILRFFRAFSSVVRQMPGYNQPRRGTARTLPNFCVVLYIVCFVSSCVLFVCKCVLYYCHRLRTQLQLINISINSKGSYTELKSIINELWYGSQITGVKNNRSSTQFSTGHRSIYVSRDECLVRCGSC